MISPLYVLAVSVSTATALTKQGKQIAVHSLKLKKYYSKYKSVSVQQVGEYMSWMSVIKLAGIRPQSTVTNTIPCIIDVNK